MFSDVTDRFLRYIAVDTQSKEEQETFPSTSKQKDLAKMLYRELDAMGAENARMSEYGYVYAEIPATRENKGLSLGFIAHMDTSPAAPGAGVHPQIVHCYDGGDIRLGPGNGQILSPADYPDLQNYVGQDLITTDGTTLLGADDKAGVAEIMTMVSYLLAHPEIPHGKICIAFTPDEEVGRGVNFFDLDGFGADVAYTVDGGALGELEYECFNAAAAKITIHGISIHPGSARGIMKNSLLIGMELHSMLPAFQNPACTDGYEGFFHLSQAEGDVECTVMRYIIRDHDRQKSEQKKALLRSAVSFLNTKYGDGTVHLEIKDSYFNMKEPIEKHPYLIDIATQSMKRLGIAPKICAIRGGTDGARLSFMGLPCPNLCTGGHNCHGRYEYISIQSMEKITKLLVEIAQAFTDYVPAR